MKKTVVIDRDRAAILKLINKEIDRLKELQMYFIKNYCVPDMQDTWQSEWSWHFKNDGTMEFTYTGDDLKIVKPSNPKS